MFEIMKTYQSSTPLPMRSKRSINKLKTEKPTIKKIEKVRVFHRITELNKNEEIKN